MMRVCLLSSGLLDADDVAHFRAIESAGVDVDFRFVEASLPLRLRRTAQLWRDRQRFDVVVTAGPDALIAAGWAGERRVHLLPPPLPAHDLSPLRRAARGGCIFVTSSAAMQRTASRTFADAFQVRLIRSRLPKRSIAKDEAKRRIHAPADSQVIYVPGVWRNRSQHLLAMWAAGVLIFRDPKVRLLVDGGGNDAVIHRLAASRGQTRSILVGAPGEWALHAAAADVAIAVGRAAPPFAILDALHQRQTPIVAAASLWRRERLTQVLPAVLVEASKPRLVARALLDVLEAPPSIPPETASETPETAAASAASAWRDLLESAATSTALPS